MPVDVEQILLPRVAVADVRHPFDLAPADGKRREQDTGVGKVAAQPGGHPGVDGGAPASTEALGQGVLDRRARPQPPPGDHHEPGRRQNGHTERRPTAR
jgi:hypothetical protein